MTGEIALRTLVELERIHSYKIDAILPDGTHRYWSTHCRSPRDAPRLLRVRTVD